MTRPLDLRSRCRRFHRSRPSHDLLHYAPLPPDGFLKSSLFPFGPGPVYFCLRKNDAKISDILDSASRHSLRFHSFSKSSSERRSTTSSCSSLFEISEAAFLAVVGVWMTSFPAIRHVGTLIDRRSDSVAPTIGKLVD